MVVDTLFTDLTAIMTPIVIIGGFIFGGIKYLNSQAEKKRILSKEEALQTANELKRLAGETAKEVRMYSDKINNEMMVKVTEVDRKVMEMLDDLKHRADLTNGNVQIIRTEIADLQEDLQDLYDEMENGGSNDNDVDREDNDRRRRQRAKKQRIKRRSIEADRINQSEHALNR